MKQKIVIKVQYANCNKRSCVYCDKCRRKALKIAAMAPGVSTVSLEGEDRDHVVVIGERVDSVSLTKVLRKKFSYAEIKSVEQVMKDDGGNNKKHNKKVELDETNHPKDLLALPYCHGHHYCPPPCVIYDSNPYGTNTCIIM